MLEYYLNNDKKNLKRNLKRLISEIEELINLEELDLRTSKKDYYAGLKGLVSQSEANHINNLYYTLDQNKKKYPYFNKYFKDQKINFKTDHKFADLFAGCGGMSLGLENAGFNLVFANEINPLYCETLFFNKNIPHDHFYVDDINKLIDNIKPFDKILKGLDLVCGGPPCQGFSMANRQRIIDDPRNNLYKAYLKFLQLTKPKFFIIENVKGMANKIDEILADIKIFLNDETNTYNISYSLLNAKDYGLPQNRERFFIIGNRIGIESKQIFENIKKNKPKHSFVLNDALINLPKLKPKNIKNKNDIENLDFGFTITKNRSIGSEFEKYLNNGRKIYYLFNHKNRYNNERDIEIFKRLPQGANSLHDSIKEIMPYSSRNHMFKDKYYKLKGTQPCKTITSHMKFDCNMYIHPNQSRGLSPREAARIQTFPDDYFIRGTQNNWYAQVGNAVPVKLAEIIGKQIIKYL